MSTENDFNYVLLDSPEVTERIFHPRPDPSGSSRSGGQRLTIPVDVGVVLDAVFHGAGAMDPNILFFHGNGEIVSDYDDLGPLYRRKNINFTVVDYRGYGRSTGRPTVTNMMRDCHVVLDFFTRWLRDEGYGGPLVVMGRSLGSASAIELAAHRNDEVRGLIVESGFAHAMPLLKLLGVPVKRLGLLEGHGFGNLEKIKRFHGPLLIIHAEFDHIIPYQDALDLYEASSSPDKSLLKIPRANHNDLFFHGLKEYLAAVQTLLSKVR